MLDNESTVEGFPISEWVVLVLNGLGLFGVINVFLTSRGGLSGFDDIAIALGAIMQMVLVILSLPFYFKAIRRDQVVAWFKTAVLILFSMLVVFVVLTLFMMGATFTQNAIFIILWTGINLLPLFLLFLYPQTE